MQIVYTASQNANLLSASILSLEKVHRCKVLMSTTLFVVCDLDEVLNVRVPSEVSAGGKRYFDPKAEIIYYHVFYLSTSITLWYLPCLRRCRPFVL